MLRVVTWLAPKSLLRIGVLAVVEAALARPLDPSEVGTSQPSRFVRPPAVCAVWLRLRGCAAKGVLCARAPARRRRRGRT
jgi:hypothetical protein